MLKKPFCIFGSIILFSVSVFFVAIAAYLFSSEVLPALKNGSFNVETHSIILNVLWEGNEIYVVLAAYTLLAGGFAYGAIGVFMKAVSRRGHLLSSSLPPTNAMRLTLVCAKDPHLRLSTDTRGNGNPAL